MNIWIKSIVAGGAVATAVFFLSEKIKKNKLIKEYSLEYTIEAKPDKESALPFSLFKIIEVLEKRLETTYYNYNIEKSGNSRVHVSLFDILDTSFPTSILTSNGRVQFRELYNIFETKEMLVAAFGIKEDKDPPPEKEDSGSRKTVKLAENLGPAVEPEKNPLLSLIEFSQPYKSETDSTIYPSEIGRVKLKDTAAIVELFRSQKVRLLTPADLQLCFGEPDKGLHNDLTLGDGSLCLYFVKTRGSRDKALLENEDISDATQGFDQYGKVEIRLQFNKSGARKWAVMTRQNIGRSIAIILNGRVKSAPNVINSIEDGSSLISGSYTLSEAQEICVGLKSSKLPASLSIINSVVKLEKSPGEIFKKLLATLISFILFSILAFYVFKALKAT